jgi:hypothetical protein
MAGVQALMKMLAQTNNESGLTDAAYFPVSVSRSRHAPLILVTMVQCEGPCILRLACVGVLEHALRVLLTGHAAPSLK